MAAVRDAIILAGGRGTRMLPASLYMPKETMPLVDTPVINHLISEAAKSGVERVHLVLSERKMGILEEFIENDKVFEDDVRKELPRDSLRLRSEGISLIPHIQYNPGGVADAISVAIENIDGPFLVLLGDMVVLDTHCSPDDYALDNASNASMELVKMYEKWGLPCVGVCTVEESEISKYGVVNLSDDMVIGLVEKPSNDEAPSNFVLCGRYLFPEHTSEILQKFPVSEFGEMQSIFLLNHLIQNDGLRAVNLDQMEIYDSGDPLSWLQSQVDHALRRDDLSNQMKEWIIERIGE